MDRILQEVLDGACGSGVRRGQNAEPAENPVGENAKMLNLWSHQGSQSIYGSSMKWSYHRTKAHYSYTS